jgi:hypothetical protein
MGKGEKEMGVLYFSEVRRVKEEKKKEKKLKWSAKSKRLAWQKGESGLGGKKYGVKI